MGKTVLILGNGFDLAHGLPTKYSDFLDFCNIIYRIKYNIGQNIEYTREEYESVLTDIHEKKTFSEWLEPYYRRLVYEEKRISQYGYSDLNKSIDIEYEILEKTINKIYDLISNNIWYSYFAALYKNKKSKINGNNWIDFESEISFIIETIDKHVRNLSHNWHVVDEVNSDDIDFPTKFNIFRTTIDNIFNKRPGNVKNVRKRMYDDLNDIISALEIYLSQFVEKFIKPDKLDLINQIMPDYIINFNYTHTYQNVYCGDVKPFHIHGELNHEPNNMVLGIDEYWSKKERDSHTNFTIFKKFAQRIQKRTGRDYFEIYNKLKQSDEQVKVYFFGHSLDVTDKDILKMFLKDDSFEVTVYCIDEEAEGEYIANIIGIIGEKKLIYKVNQEPARLEFKLINEEKEPLTSGAAP